MYNYKESMELCLGFAARAQFWAEIQLSSRNSVMKCGGTFKDIPYTVQSTLPCTSKESHKRDVHFVGCQLATLFAVRFYIKLVSFSC